MIRRGKHEGWLDAPKSSLLTWARLHGCQFSGVTVNSVEGRGHAVIAEQRLAQDAEALMTVPEKLILSRETVELFAKSDRYLREVLGALGSFGQVHGRRGA